MTDVNKGCCVVHRCNDQTSRRAYSTYSKPYSSTGVPRSCRPTRVKSAVSGLQTLRGANPKWRKVQQTLNCGHGARSMHDEQRSDVGVAHVG
eukprot:4063161-Pyramimonas_sp.AAC.1